MSSATIIAVEIRALHKNAKVIQEGDELFITLAGATPEQYCQFKDELVGRLNKHPGVYFYNIDYHFSKGDSYVALFDFKFNTQG